MGQTCLKAQVRGAQKLHSPLWARKMGGLSKWNQKNLTGNYGPKCFETRVKGMKNNSQLWGKNPNYGPKNDSLASLLSSLFSFLFPFFVLFLFSTLLFSLHCVFVSFLFILAPVSFLLCFFSLLSSLFFFSL